MKTTNQGRFISVDLKADRFLWLLLVCLALSIAWWILDSAGSATGTRTGRILSGELTEISGIVLSRRNKGVIWAHNDSGGQARVFGLDTKGSLLGVFPLRGAAAIDWEDIAIGPGPLPELDYLYIADTGNNELSRQTIIIYRVLEPSVTTTSPSGGQELTDVEALPMRFPSKPRECEALLVDPKNGDIFLVTRDRNQGANKVASIFHAPAPHKDGALKTLRFLTSFRTPSSIKAGDVSRDGRMIALRSHSRRGTGGALLWKRTNLDQALYEIFHQRPQLITLHSESKGESISFCPDGRFLFTVSEGRRAPIYRFELP